MRYIIYFCSFLLLSLFFSPEIRALSYTNTSHHLSQQDIPGNQVTDQKKDTLETTKKITEPDTIHFNDLNEFIIEEDLIKRNGNEDVITITKTMLEGVKNTGELLGKLQGIFYDPVSGEILFHGSPNILVLIDGVEKKETLIKRLKPERFDKITVTSFPSGMY